MALPELSQFEAALGAPVSLEAGALEVKATVQDVKALPKHGSRQPFSVVFRSTHGESQDGGAETAPPLAQQIVKVREETLGEMELFLVPLGPGGDGFDYEAVFN